MPVPKPNPKQTSPKVARDAARILGDPKSTPAQRRVAGSDLAQARPRPAPRKGK